MDSAPKDRRMIVTAVLVAVALLLGGLVGWLARGGEIRDLEERLAESEAEAPAETTPTAEPTETPAATEPDPEAVPPASGSVSSPTVERQPALVVSTRSAGGVRYLTVDYIQFLTGAEAAAAAAARGDESPPPNDYYIVNDNPRLREFPVQAGITVSVVTNDDGTSRPEGRSLSLNDWIARITGSDSAMFLANFYWITITDGTITAIEAQYVP